MMKKEITAATTMGAAAATDLNDAIHGVADDTPVATNGHPNGRVLTPFDREVDAIRQILGAKGVMSVDELRRGIEAIPEAEYHRLGYYERWVRSIADNLLASGVVSEAELIAALEQAA